ncbi:LTA synthase family protein [[Clostridium] spiroforme]|nr:LTA synthase family protein [Thomasclavelia spiroformis]
MICVYGLFAIRWSVRTFDVKSINQMIYHLVVPCDGTDDGVYQDLFKETLPQTIVITAIFIVLVKWTPLKILYQYQLLFSIVLTIVTVIIALMIYRIPGYLFFSLQKTNLYEKYYRDPRQVKLEFTEKRNLIHIYLESVENTYASYDQGGQFEENFIPELSQLCQKHLNFSHDEHMGGAKMIEGTQWTIASMVAQTAGIPLFIDLSKKYDKDSPYLPGCQSLGEILKEQGYVTELLQGSQADFGCTSNYYRQHGDFYIADYENMKKTGRLPEDYMVFWGFEDQKLFSFAREDLTYLASLQQPFYLEMVTIDTHTPDGYVCPACRHEHDKQYANVISCQSRQVDEFVSWCQKQPWYENTTIVITGDHNSMSEKFFKNLDRNYIRTPYNCFINSAIKTQYHKNRDFALFDFFPTILASMGVKIEGERLGLGTNLFSGKKTVMEEIGDQRLNHEVIKKSKIYKKILGQKT